MRRIFLCILLITAVESIHAQLYITAGANRTSVDMTGNGSANISEGYGWQMGATTQFPISKNGFLYTGLVYQVSRTSVQHFSCCVFEFNETRRTENIILPAGIGIKVPLDVPGQLQFAAGPYLAMGVGGNVKGVSTGGDIIIPPPTYYDRKISYGNNDKNDLLRWAWGLETQASLLFKKIGLSFHYRFTMSKAASGDAYFLNDYKYARYRTASLDLTYKLFDLHK